MQAASEELQASNEELAASNEELAVMNSELQINAGMLTQANADLKSIQSSLATGMVVVDGNLRVVRYTPLAVRLFSLIESDIGMPLLSVPTAMPIPGLEELMRVALEESRPGMAEVHGPTFDYLVTCQPYIDGMGAVIGVILLSTDLTALSVSRRATSRSVSDFQRVMDAISEAVWLQDADGVVRIANRRFGELFGLDDDELPLNPELLLTVVHPQDRARVAAAARSQRISRSVSYRVVRPDGVIRWIEQRSSVVPEVQEIAAATVNSAIDITAQRVAEDRCRRLNDVLDAVFANASLAALLLDSQGRIIQANEAFSTLLGYPHGTLVGTLLRLLVAGSSAPDTDADRLAPLPTTGTFERILTGEDGSLRTVSMTVSPVRAEEDQDAAAVVLMNDVTSSRSVSDALALQARYDAQTGAMTRAYFRDQVIDELARAKLTDTKLAALWIDLDGFKAVNDQYGHEVGDIVLREAVRRLRAVTRAGDRIGRFGGDEFVILVKGIDVIRNLELEADRILAAFCEPIETADRQIQVTASVGIAISPEDGAEVDQFLRNADTAMYVAKREGGNRRVYFRSEMNARSRGRAKVREELACATRNHDFQMFYQPVVCASDRQVVAVEALLRWHHDDEIVPAAMFVDVATESSQMNAIGKLVLSMVDSDITTLTTAGYTDLPVAMNVSRSELDDRALLDALLAWQPAGGLARVVIEVQEDPDVTASGRTADALALMRRLGARVAIDAFGSGYSNLAALHDTRPSVVKLDRSLLVGACGGDESGGNVLSAAVVLAQALEAQVVVEGVETQYQFEVAQDAGAEFVQGNFIAAPMPLDQLLNWLKQPTTLLSKCERDHGTGG